MIINKVKQTIKKHRMISRGDRVLVAVSGGPDSVCLLNVLHASAGELGISLHVAHLDHMFRGRESGDEALFVADLAKKLDIPASIGAIDVPSFCRLHGVSSQAGARQVRYGFLSKAAIQVQASRIATGHTATDQAETLLMRLMRGAGLSSLSAIPPVRNNIIRPLIQVTRVDVLEYLASNGLKYVTDPSNEKPVYTRNKIRLDVLPVLRQFNPRIVETLAAEADLMRDEDEAMTLLLAAFGAEIIRREENELATDIKAFNAEPKAIRRRLLKKFVDMLGSESAGLSFVQVEEALAFIASSTTGRSMKLPFGLFLEREYEYLVVRAGSAAALFSQVLAIPGITPIPELNMEIETAICDSPKAAAEDQNYNWHALFDYAKIKNPLILRTRRPGDWFCPSGMEGRSKKLQDYFVDIKLPRRKRDRVPLLVAGQDIVWAIGLRTDERFLPTSKTNEILMVKSRQNG